MLVLSFDDETELEMRLLEALLPERVTAIDALKSKRVCMKQKLQWQAWQASVFDRLNDALFSVRLTLGLSTDPTHSCCNID